MPPFGKPSRGFIKPFAGYLQIKFKRSTEYFDELEGADRT